MFLIAFQVLLVFFIDYVIFRFILSFILAYELFDLENGDKIPVINLFFKAGYWCQEKLFTKEPIDNQLAAAIDTAKKLMELEEEGKCCE
jgi:uncharacterized protein YqhQ